MFILSWWFTKNETTTVCSNEENSTFLSIEALKTNLNLLLELCAREHKHPNNRTRTRVQAESASSFTVALDLESMWTKCTLVCSERPRGERLSQRPGKKMDSAEQLSWMQQIYWHQQTELEAAGDSAVPDTNNGHHPEPAEQWPLQLPPRQFHFFIPPRSRLPDA